MSEGMDKDELKSILEQHESWIKSIGGIGGKRADLRWANLQRADLRWANLREANLKRADLQSADLRWANLRWANLQRADLRWANLRSADLRWADLQDANLRWANLRWADLREANLRWANLQDADLRWANLDGACLPLWCGIKKMKVDKRIASQIAAHFCALDCDDADYQAARTAILEFAQTSHMADELGLLEEREE